MKQWQSGMYVGKIRHRRHEPKKRSFSHRVVYFYLDLSEISELFHQSFFLSYEKWGVFSFKRKHFYKGKTNQPLDQAIRDLVQNQLGFRPAGPVRMLAQIGYLGFCFNPVTFYYCWDQQDHLVAIVSEITNTPWNERHTYVNAVSSTATPFEMEKEFHVSPFLSMNFIYRWFFSTPQQTLTVHMENHLKGKTPGVPYFDATLTLERREWTKKNLILTLAQQPFMTFKTLSLIYAHALILWMRKFPFFPHPHSQTNLEKES